MGSRERWLGAVPGVPAVSISGKPKSQVFIRGPWLGAMASDSNLDLPVLSQRHWWKGPEVPAHWAVGRESTRIGNPRRIPGQLTAGSLTFEVKLVDVF